MENFPVEMISTIFEYLSVEDKITCRLASRLFRDILGIYDILMEKYKSESKIIENLYKKKRQEDLLEIEDSFTAAGSSIMKNNFSQILASEIILGEVNSKVFEKLKQYLPADYKLSEVPIKMLQNGRIDMVEYFIEKEVFSREKVLEVGETSFSSLLKAKKFSGLEYLVEKYDFPREILRAPRSLRIVLTEGSVDVLDYIIKICDLNYADIQENLFSYNDFKNHLEYLTIHGKLEMIKYLFEKYPELKLGNICPDSNSEYLDRLLINSYKSSLISSSARNGNLKVLEYLYSELEVTRDNFEQHEYRDMLVETAASGCCREMEFLRRVFKLTAEDVREENNMMLRMSASSGEKEMVEYLIETFDLTVEDIRIANDDMLIDVLNNGQIKVFKYLIEKAKISLEEIRENDLLEQLDFENIFFEDDEDRDYFTELTGFIPPAFD